MRIAVLSDIHGNLLALDACLADLESQGSADAIVVAGDLCLGGPKPKKVLQRLEEIGAACVRGNTDRYLSEDSSREKRSQLESAQIAWTRHEIGERWAAWLKDLPFALRIGEDNNQLLIVHANPLTDDEHLWPDADDTILRRFVGKRKQVPSPSGTSTSPTFAYGAGSCLPTWRRRAYPKTAIREPVTRSSPSARGDGK
jgi:Icc-related predicted phosphoesterase